MFETYDPGATQRPVDLRYPLFDVRFIEFALSLPTSPWCVNKAREFEVLTRLVECVSVRELRLGDRLEDLVPSCQTLVAAGDLAL
jgi:hypothetical protein